MSLTRAIPRPESADGQLQYCTLGQENTSIRTNHFSIIVDPSKKSLIYRYEVEITAERSSNRLNVSKRRQVMEEAWRYASRHFVGARDKLGYGYEGNKLLLTCIELQLPHDGSPLRVQVQLQQENYIIEIKQLTGIHDLNEFVSQINSQYDVSDVLAALDIIIQTKAKLQYEITSRSTFFYHQAQRETRLPCGRRMIIPGLFNSVRPGEDMVTLNADAAATVVVIEQSFLDLYDNGRYTIEECNAYVNELSRNVEIFVDVDLPTQKVKRFQNFVQDTAASKQFNYNGSTTTVQKYYLEVKGYKIKHPNYPLVKVHNPRIEELYPLELCCIKGDQIAAVNKGSAEQTALVRYMGQMKPQERFYRIVGDLKKLLTPESVAAFTDFRFSIITEAVTVSKARTLPPVKVEFPKSKLNITKWAVLRTPGRMLANQAQWIESFRQAMRSACQVELSQNPKEDEVKSSAHLQSLYEYFQKEKCQFVVCLVNKSQNQREHKEIYGHIKQLSDRHFYIPTQCVDVGKDEKKLTQPSFLANLALKVNDKLGGYNAVVPETVFTQLGLKDLRKGTMIVGADVAHPGQFEQTKPSIAAIVGSVDAYAIKYVATTIVQSRTGARRDANCTQEWIKGCDGAMKQLLKRYQQENKETLPRQIIVFRDGVSEGQFPIVLREELKQIKEACAEVYQVVNYQPKITYLVVCKRVHTKFFFEFKRASSKHGDDSINNVPAGTIVEGDVTQPHRYFEWFMVPHESPLGTAKPTRYVVLHDDNKYTPDDLIYLAFSLCHAFPRSPRKAISLPAPAYHADLAAERANQHLAARPFNNATGNIDADREAHLAHARCAIEIDTIRCLKNYWG